MPLYPGVYSLKQQLQAAGQAKWPNAVADDNLARTGTAGLAGKFFNGYNTANLYTGTVGSLPLTTNNDSSNVTGSGGMPSAAYRYGVNAWPYITYGTYGNSNGESYSFIAIGYFKPPVSGIYSFYLYSDDSSAMWLGNLAAAASGRVSGNMLVLINSAGAKRGSAVWLTKDVWYPIRIVHEEGYGADYLTFSWAGPMIAETTSLSTYFKAPAINGVLTGNYL